MHYAVQIREALWANGAPYKLIKKTLALTLDSDKPLVALHLYHCSILNLHNYFISSGIYS